MLTMMVRKLNGDNLGLESAICDALVFRRQSGHSFS